RLLWNATLKSWLDVFTKIPGCCESKWTASISKNGYPKTSLIRSLSRSWTQQQSLAMTSRRCCIRSKRITGNAHRCETRTISRQPEIAATRLLQFSGSSLRLVSNHCCRHTQFRAADLPQTPSPPHDSLPTLL